MPVVTIFVTVVVPFIVAITAVQRILGGVGVHDRKDERGAQTCTQANPIYR